MNDFGQYLEQELHTAEVDLKRLQYINGDKECQDDILKLKGRIELLQELKEKNGDKR